MAIKKLTEKDKIAKKLATMSPNEIKALYTKPELFLLPHQIPPAPMTMRGGKILKRPWRYFLLCGGRGAGKTYAGVSWLFGKIMSGAKNVAMVGPDFRSVENDLVPLFLNCAPPDEVKNGLWEWNAQRGIIKCPGGAECRVYTSFTEIRGPNPEYCFCDEIVKWCDCNPKLIQERFDVLDLAVRIGDYPQIFIASTPKPMAFFKKFFKQIEEKNPDYALTVASMNQNPHLSAAFKNVMKNKHEGSRFGAQEIDGIVSFDIDGALWTPELIENTRVSKIPNHNGYDNPLHFFLRIVVAVDPAVSNSENSDHTGIIVMGLGEDMKAYLIEDASMKGSPQEWAGKVSSLCQKYSCDTVVAEINNGYDLVEYVLRAHLKNYRPRIKKIHANRGKLIRARPVLALHEQKEICFIGFHPELETEMCEYSGSGKDDSPDRLDAFVYAATELLLEEIDSGPPDLSGLPDFS